MPRSSWQVVVALWCGAVSALLCICVACCSRWNFLCCGVHGPKVLWRNAGWAFSLVWVDVSGRGNRIWKESLTDYSRGSNVTRPQQYSKSLRLIATRFNRRDHLANSLAGNVIVSQGTKDRHVTPRTGSSRGSRKTRPELRSKVFVWLQHGPRNLRTDLTHIDQLGRLCVSGCSERQRMLIVQACQQTEPRNSPSGQFGQEELMHSTMLSRVAPKSNIFFT